MYNHANQNYLQSKQNGGASQAGSSVDGTIVKLTLEVRKEEKHLQNKYAPLFSDVFKPSAPVGKNGLANPSVPVGNAQKQSSPSGSSPSQQQGSSSEGRDTTTYACTEKNIPITTKGFFARAEGCR